MKRYALLLALAATCLLAAGCVNNKWRTDEAKDYVDAQKELATNRKPLFELKAQPGQTITLSGVESLTVNDPREAKIEALPSTPSPFWHFLDTALRVGAQAYGVHEIAQGVTGIAQTIATHAGDHSATTITGSYNTQGDTLNGSIRGDVTGAGAGIGNTYRSADTGVTGNGNVTGSTAGRDVNVGDENGNSGRQGSPGPIDDHSVPGQSCTGDGCQGSTGGQ